MTETLHRPAAPSRPTTARPSEASPSLWLRGALAAVWAVALGLAVLVVLALLAWATDSRSGSGAGTVMRTALQLWLVAHKVPLHLPAGGTLSLAPLGLTLALGALVARGAAVVARGQQARDAVDVAMVTAAVAIPYAVLSAFVAAAVGTSGARPMPVGALLGGAAVGLLAAGAGAVRGAGGTAALGGVVPRPVSAAAGAASRAGAVVLGGALVFVLAAVAVHSGAVLASSSRLGGGFVSQVELALLELALLPNAVAAALGYAVGPGFALGVGTSVTAGGVHLGALPALPLLAAVPHAGAPAAVRVAAVLVVLAAAVWAGLRAGTAAPGSWLRAAGLGAGAAVTASVVLTLVVAAAGGSAGPGRMSAVGASPWRVGLLAAAQLVPVAAAVAAARAWAAARR